MVISVQYLTDPVRPTIKFLSTTSPVVYSRTGWVSSQSMGNSEIKYEIERDFPKGSYKIAIETSDGKTSDEFKETIQIL